MDFRLIFVRDSHTKLFQGMLNNEVMLLRVWRVPVDAMVREDLDRSGLDPQLHPFVYYVYRDNWEDKPYEAVAGPLTLEGVTAVMKAAVMSYNENTNFGAF